MDAVKIIEEALHDLEHSKITCGEFDRIVEPFRDCVPVKHGKWITYERECFDENTTEPWHKCTCGYETRNKTPYCPNCGARMNDELKPEEYEVIYKFTVAPTVPFQSESIWNAEPVGELIRCKDCIRNGTPDCAMEYHYMDSDWRFNDYSWNNENDYCSRAERKEE